MNTSLVEFSPIRLPEHQELCLAFTRDAFLCSYGDDSNFWESDRKGPERYLGWLKEKLNEDPASAVHVSRGETVIGQVELSRFKLDPVYGYVSLYYLVPEVRGTGI